MFLHTCQIEDQAILGQRCNPLNGAWNEWTLVACTKCKRVREWQHHTDEQPHGGDLQITAIPTADYLKTMYGLDESDIELLLARKKKARRYNRYTHEHEESYVS